MNPDGKTLRSQDPWEGGSDLFAIRRNVPSPAAQDKHPRTICRREKWNLFQRFIKSHSFPWRGSPWWTLLPFFQANKWRKELQRPWLRPSRLRGSLMVAAEAPSSLPIDQGQESFPSFRWRGLRFLFLLDSLQTETTKVIESCSPLPMVWIETTRLENSRTLAKMLFCFSCP